MGVEGDQEVKIDFSGFWPANQMGRDPLTEKGEIGVEAGMGWKSEELKTFSLGMLNL